MNIYSRRDIGVMSFAAGLLAGLVLGFAACSPPPEVIDSRTGICLANCR